ncbi:uncharacterized protein LOC113371248 [Ctenocephalides felis]|uniref:uncharacterized protein LOC113371248 n=1 Tax=Ctenocephalides felis TaxID=7515 RepID=UPI000E6E1413|nr:uncharacterized protein LOC113371248 [Ctenocephalides felis]
MEEFSEHVQVALKQLIAKSGINNYEVKLSPASKKGDNYLGTLYRVEIISTDNDKDTKLNLICKIPSSDWGSEDNWQKIHIPYEREVYVYNVILKSFEKLQNDKNLNENQKFASYALCHVASDVNKKEFLILEDLHARNFVMFDKRKKMDFSHITLVAKGLAKYHALSFVMRDQQPEKFHKITQIDSAMYDMTGREAFYDLCDFGLKQALEAIDDGGITEFHENVKKIKDNCEEYMESCFNATGSENYRVLSHGDCWNNNMMFKYQGKSMALLQDHVQKAVQNIILEQQITNYNIEVTPGSNAGDNYGSTIYRIQVKGRRSNGDTTLSLICKVPIATCKVSQSLGFKREIHTYKNLLKDLKQFQEEKKIQFIDGFNTSIKCYDADDTIGKEYIIFEDLKPQGFTMLAKDVYIDKIHAQHVVKELAKFHAISFAMKDQKPKEFKRLSNLPEVIFEIIGEQPLNNLCKLALERALNFMSEKGSEDYLVITHADCWKNNMMFKYENGCPKEMRLFDWQITRLASPAMDLCYFFYISGNDELIEQHFDNLMEIYYEQLKKSVKLLGSDITRLYPRSILETDLKKFAGFGIIFCIFGMNVLLAETPPDMGDMFIKASEENSEMNASVILMPKHKKNLPIESIL